MATKTKKSRWDTQKLSGSRSKREAASAPRQNDLKIYEKFLKQAIKNKKNPKALILGATPELRDLCLKHKCETVAVDVSWNVLVAMHKQMKYKNNPKNKVALYDWLQIDKLFKNNYFDVALADASLNNLKTKYHLPMFKVLNRVLKPRAGFITRNAVLQKELVDKPISFFQKAYNQGDLDWLEYYWVFLVIWHKQIEIAPYEHSVAKLNHKFKVLLNKKLVKIRPADKWKIDNVIFHAAKVVHTEFPKNKFEQMAKKYFKVVDVDYKSKNKEIRYIPIYYFKNKK